EGQDAGSQEINPLAQL
nr:Cu-dependent amine oxidase, BSAO {peptide 4} {EC 1.4.3.6} [cattle, serum, Peptide Partial, 16 aa] [Bos taurus]